MRRLIWLTLAALVVVACNGAGDDAPDTEADATDGGATITIEGFSFGDPVEVAEGETVTVTNADGVTHTWTSTDGVFDSGRLDSGAEFSFTFDQPGEYAFSCRIHPNMTGTLTVTG